MAKGQLIAALLGLGLALGACKVPKRPSTQ
jgi:hypothetical protein